MPSAVLTDIVRSRGDPRVEREGPSSSTDADRLARALGWFSVGLDDAALAGVDAAHRRRPGRGRDVPTPPDHLAEGTVAATLPAA